MYCICYNSIFGCHIDNCKKVHKKIPKGYKTRICNYANDNIIEHDVICSRGKKCKFAKNIKEYLIWKNRNITMEFYKNKSYLCNYNGILHNLYCNKDCIYSKDINEYNEWLYIYNKIYN